MPENPSEDVRRSHAGSMERYTLMAHMARHPRPGNIYTYRTPFRPAAKTKL